MVDATHYYFETLPVHPPPERLESFTSYLTRLAEANGLRSMGALASTCFFDEYVRTMRWQKDTPPVSFGQLPIAAVCHPSELLATTFFHLGKKFERPGQPQSLAHFLSGAIARFLRYCPQCIAETPYYRLTWRFLPLSGCVRHNTRLLSICGHCDHSIPVFTSPFKIGICPHCQGDLRLCQAATLTTEEFNSVVADTQELEFLLLPQPWEASANAKRMGAYFADLRLKRHLTVAQVAGLIGTTRHGVEAVEYGNIGASSSPFERYIRYALFLGVSLQDVFEATMLQNSWLKGPRVRNLPLSEEEMVERLEQAIQRLNDRGVLVTQRTLSKESGIARNRFVSYPRVRDLLKEAASSVRTSQERQREQRQEVLLMRVQIAIDHLEALGVPVTQKAICEIAGMTPPGLKGYPRVKELLARYSGQHCHYIIRRSSLREDELVAEVEMAIKHLTEMAQPLTQVSIAHSVGVNLSSLKKYPKVRKMVEQNAVRNHRDRVFQKENELLEKVEAAVEQLTALGERITQRAIGRIVGVVPSQLKWYPHVAALLEQYASKLRYDSRGQSQSREEYLIAEVRKAIKQLEDANQPITQQAIAELLGVFPSYLTIYERVDTLLKQVASRAHLDLYRSEQARCSEDAMALNVEKAIAQLKMYGEPITQRSVSKILGVPASSLYYYPKVITILKTVVRVERYQSQLAQTQLREDDLVTKVLGAIENLRTSGRVVSIRAIVKAVQISEGALKRYPKVNLILDKLYMRVARSEKS